jgi:hypothetical protein
MAGDLVAPHVHLGNKSYYFPQLDFQCLIFLMGLLTNTTDWFRIKTMRMWGDQIWAMAGDLVAPHVHLGNQDTEDPHCLDAEFGFCKPISALRLWRFWIISSRSQEIQWSANIFGGLQA